jgi:hypothetical protein
LAALLVSLEVLLLEGEQLLEDHQEGLFSDDRFTLSLLLDPIPDGKVTVFQIENNAQLLVLWGVHPSAK